jgi:hypothetical protein
MNGAIDETPQRDASPRLDSRVDGVAVSIPEYHIVPVTFQKANEFVSENHRHNKKTVGYKFTIGLEANGELVGVAIVGRPVARNLDDGRTLEVNRVCVLDGYPNANSMLYGACGRIAREMGYNSIYTYTLSRESGSSLKAVGWTNDGMTSGGAWGSTYGDGKTRANSWPIEPKVRWVLHLRGNPINRKGGVSEGTTQADKLTKVTLDGGGCNP